MMKAFTPNRIADLKPTYGRWATRARSRQGGEVQYAFGSETEQVLDMHATRASRHHRTGLSSVRHDA